MKHNSGSSWTKHWDFILLDSICLVLTLILAYWLRHNDFKMFDFLIYREECLVILFANVFVAFFMESYQGILRRSVGKEFLAVFQHLTMVFGLGVFFLFITKSSEEFSRLTMLIHYGLSMVMVYLVRLLRKKTLYSHADRSMNVKSLLLLSTVDKAEEVLASLKKNHPVDYRISGLVLLDGEKTHAPILNVPVVAGLSDMICYIQTNWVDGVFVTELQVGEDIQEILRDCINMGVAVHLMTNRFLNTNNQYVMNIGEYQALTSSVVVANDKQMLLKRVMDIVGGLVGCVITGILCIILGPIIFIQSPGPIFFKQKRIGQGGKTFYMYKFRSMYMDAEERKKELMEQNRIKDGLMFKMENDPRIIKGIGHFIRNTSLDEFPQFLNVLKGDMSLIGTRPPTEDEWNKYQLHHRIRMAIKPGITGMWQVSGRSNIMDFEEVVALDEKYIREWSLGLDIKILLKTVKVVFAKDGSM